MKILIVSDLHGNMEALGALAERERYDELWVLGDLVNYGPQPGEVIDFVRTHASTVISGNHDYSIAHDVDPRCSSRFREMAEETRRFTAGVLSEEQRAYLCGLPLTLNLERAGTTFQLCHAVPSNPLYTYCRAASDAWVAELSAVSADVLLVGHTHLPFVQRLGEKMVVNPGSLGQPKTGRPEACYAVWENGEVELKWLAYQVETTVGKLEKMPLSPRVRMELATVLREGGI